MSLFTPAIREAAAPRIAIAGPSGSGKTWTALTIATGLAGDNRVAGIDTENSSMLDYADLFDFDHLALYPPYGPEPFIEGIRAAENAGYGAVIVDTASHAWKGPGGVLSTVDQLKQHSKNQIAPWAEGDRMHEALLSAVLFCQIPIIVTYRAKETVTLNRTDEGRNEVVRLGMQPVARDMTLYEFTLWGDLDLSHTLTIEKSRIQSFPVGSRYPTPGVEFGEQIREWATGGSERDASITVLDSYRARAQGHSGEAVRLWIWDQVGEAFPTVSADTRRELAVSVWNEAVTAVGRDPGRRDSVTASDLAGLVAAVEASPIFETEEGS